MDERSLKGRGGEPWLAKLQLGTTACYLLKMPVEEEERLFMPFFPFLGGGPPLHRHKVYTADDGRPPSPSVCTTNSMDGYHMNLNFPLGQTLAKSWNGRVYLPPLWRAARLGGSFQSDNRVPLDHQPQTLNILPCRGRNRAGSGIPNSPSQTAECRQPTCLPPFMESGKKEGSLNQLSSSGLHRKPLTPPLWRAYQGQSQSTLR